MPMIDSVQIIQRHCNDDDLLYALMQESGPYTEAGMRAALDEMLFCHSTIATHIENHIDEIEALVVAGNQQLPRQAVEMVFARMLRHGRLDEIKKAFANAGRLKMDYENDALAERAIEKGLDPYAVCERAAIMEIDGGLPRWQAAAYALGECAVVDCLERHGDERAAMDGS